MSKGHGSVQRAILDYLDLAPRQHTETETTYAPWRQEQVTRLWPGWTTVRDLATKIFAVAEPARAQVESVRRAVKHLAAEGLAEVSEVRTEYLWSRAWNGKRTSWALAARPVLSPEEQESAEESLRPRPSALTPVEAGKAVEAMTRYLTS